MYIRRVNVSWTYGIKGYKQNKRETKITLQKNKFLIPELRRMLCNAPFQSHFDYAYPAWYPNLTKNTNKTIQIMQSKCIRFCLRLDKMQHIYLMEFRSIKWLPIKERVHQWINAITFKFVNNNCPIYLNEVFKFAPHCRTDTKNSFANLKHLFRKSNTSQKTLSVVINEAIWRTSIRSRAKPKHSFP